MDYSDESYVRLYTRRTLTNRRLGWEGRAVMHAMLGEFDRSGIFAIEGDPAECIAIMTDVPLEIVRVGLERLVATGTWRLTDDAVVWPAYVEAQTCRRSDQSRAQAYRERRAASAAGTEPRAAQNMEARHAPSHAVTRRHAPSRIVTPSLALPNQAFLSGAPAEPSKESEAEPGTETEPDATETEPEAPPRPPIDLEERRRRRGGPRSAGHGAALRSYPEGWQWAIETEAAAAALGVTPAELRRHVNYWTSRRWAVAVTDLDLELRLALPGILERRPKARDAPATDGPRVEVPGMPSWVFAAHERLASSLGVDLGAAARAFAREYHHAPGGMRRCDLYAPFEKFIRARAERAPALEAVGA